MKKDCKLKSSLLVLMLLIATTGSFAQKTTTTTTAKRDNRKNMVMREYNTDAKGKNSWLDHETTYNAKGLKIIDIEYASYGLKSKITYEYDAQDRCIKDVIYDSKEKPVRIRKYEYNADGTKKKQYNYLPNGRLYSTKIFEYSFQD